jgi:DNA-binding transcriptional MocR family regulator
LLKQWGPAQFDVHVNSIIAFYKSQRDAFLASADRHLTGLAEWNVPQAG